MKNYLKKIIPAFFLMVCAFSTLACVRQKEVASAAEISAFESGSLHVPYNKKAPKTIYVDMNDSTGHVAIPPQQLQSLLAGENFEIVDNPSKAGYILHISLLQEGKVAPEALRHLVDAGYGSDAKFSGDGASAWLADALLVQRQVPSHKRPSRARLKNVSARNALGSTQMRLGIMAPENLSGRNAFLSAFGKELATRICDSLAPKSQASAMIQR